MKHKKENPVTVSSLATDTVTGFTEHNRCKTRLAFIVGYLILYSKKIVIWKSAHWCAPVSVAHQCARAKRHNLYNLYYTTKVGAKLVLKVGLNS